MKRFLIGCGLGVIAALVSHAFGLSATLALLIGLAVAAVVWFKLYRLDKAFDVLGDLLG